MPAANELSCRRDKFPGISLKKKPSTVPNGLKRLITDYPHMGWWIK